MATKAMERLRFDVERQRLADNLNYRLTILRDVCLLLGLATLSFIKAVLDAGCAFIEWLVFWCYR